MALPTCDSRGTDIRYSQVTVRLALFAKTRARKPAASNMIKPVSLAQSLSVQPVNGPQRGISPARTGHSLRRRRDSERLLLQQVVHLQATSTAQPDPGASRQGPEPPADPVPSSSSPELNEEPKTLWQRVQRFFGSGKLDRERLAKLGTPIP
jgi:hypothetical protein